MATGVVIKVARGAVGQIVTRPEDEAAGAVEGPERPTEGSTGVDADAEEA